MFQGLTSRCTMSSTCEKGYPLLPSSIRSNQPSPSIRSSRSIFRPSTSWTLTLSGFMLLFFLSSPVHGNWADEDGLLNDVPKHRVMDGDELIISGDGAGCWDDEDCTTYATDVASDDLITPQIVMMATKSPFHASAGMRTSTMSPRGPYNRGSACDDDEDCIEGGSGNGYSFSSSRNNHHSNNNRPYLSSPKPSDFFPSVPYSWNGMRTPAPTPYYPRPPPTPFEDKSIMFTSKPIPPDPNYSERQTPRPRPTPPPRPTGPRVIVDVPRPHQPHREREKPGPRPPPTTASTATFSKSSADKTALVIGVVAFIIIVIVIVAPVIVFIKVRVRQAEPKSIDNRKNYQFNSVSGTPALLVPNASGSVTHLTGPGLPISGEFQAPQIPPKKDLKEWYV